MTKIHHVVETTIEEERVKGVPEFGVVERKVKAPSSADRIVSGDRTFEVQPDGAFEVPDEVAKHFLRMPGWYGGLPPFQSKQSETPRRGPRVRVNG